MPKPDLDPLLARRWSPRKLDDRPVPVGEMIFSGSWGESPDWIERSRRDG
jgi:hypothetical protein